MPSLESHLAEFQPDTAEGPGGLENGESAPEKPLGEAKAVGSGETQLADPTGVIDEALSNTDKNYTAVGPFSDTKVTAKCAPCASLCIEHLE